MNRAQVITNFSPKVCEEATVTWKLQGYSWIKDKPRGEAVISPVLFQGTALEAKLRLYPNGTNDTTEGAYNSLYLDLRNLDNSKFQCTCNLTLRSQREDVEDEIADVDDMEVFVQDSKCEINGVRCSTGLLGFADFVKIQDMGNYTIDDSLLFELFIKVWSTSVQSQSLLLLPDDCNGCSSELSTDFGKILQNGLQSDVTLRVGDKDLLAHKLILSARSPVFSQMFFSSGMQETLQGAVVQVDDMDFDTAVAFLHAVYTAKVPQHVWENSDLLCLLLRCFHKYGLQHLLDRCEKQVAASLAVENVCEMLMLADLLQLQLLGSRASAFITCSAKQLSDIQATEGFQRLCEQRPKLAFELLAQRIPTSFKRPSSSSSEPLPDNLDDLTVLQLKQLLSDRGLSTSGDKSALLARLREHASS